MVNFLEETEDAIHRYCYYAPQAYYIGTGIYNLSVRTEDRGWIPLKAWWSWNEFKDKANFSYDPTEARCCINPNLRIETYGVKDGHTLVRKRLDGVWGWCKLKGMAGEPVLAPGVPLKSYCNMFNPEPMRYANGC